MNKVPWYNTAICPRLNGSLFGDFIKHEGTNRYNIMCSLVAHDKKLPTYEDDERIIVDRLIPKHVKTEALEAFVATLNFIDIWLKLLKEKNDAIRVAYITVMKTMFKQIPTTMTKPLSQKQKVQKLMIEIGGGWYTKKIIKRPPPLRRSKLSKTAQYKDEKIKKTI